MKILLISHAKDDKNAGASRVYHLLADALRERGHAVTLYHYDDLRIPRLLSYVVKRVALPEFISWRFYREATRDYDVIFCSNGMAHPIFRKLREKSPRPYLIHHLHGLSYFDYLAVVTERMRGHVDLGFLFLKLKGHFPVKWDAEGARHADIIIAQNIRDQDYIEDQRSRQEDTGANCAPVVQVPAALHPRLEQAGRNAPPPETRNPTSLLWFGSWRERKGHAYLGRAFREVKEQFPDATLTIGGAGGDAASVPDSFDVDLRSSVRVLPRIEIDEQIREYYAHGIFIFPSLSEGFGLALIEAMTMGLACVTTQTGVGSDFIEDGVHAVVVAMASSRHLARGLIRLIRDDALRQRIARQGQQLARQFTVERSVNEYLDIFEKRPGAKGSA